MWLGSSLLSFEQQILHNPLRVPIRSFDPLLSYHNLSTMALILRVKGQTEYLHFMAGDHYAHYSYIYSYSAFAVNAAVLAATST